VRSNTVRYRSYATVSSNTLPIAGKGEDELGPRTEEVAAVTWSGRARRTPEAARRRTWRGAATWRATAASRIEQ
jgi:hypothetical protein